MAIYKLMNFCRCMSVSLCVCVSMFAPLGRGQHLVALAGLMSQMECFVNGKLTVVYSDY